MTWWLLFVLVVLTFGSRAAALTFLPAPSDRLVVILDRMPPALFAGLAAAALFDSSGDLLGWPLVVAAGGALLLAPLRSLFACLAGGVVGYALALLLIGG